MKNLLIIGAGGYSKSVLDSLDYDTYNFIGFVDEYYHGEHLGYPILYSSIFQIPNKEDYSYFIAIGNNEQRKRWYDILISNNLDIISVYDKSSIISPNAEIGNGVFVGKLAIINSKAKIGNNCIINTRALIEHGCCVDNHVNVSTNSTLNGDVNVGEGTFVGSGSVVIGQKNIGSWSMIGAGAVVIRDVPNNTTVVGIPAREI